MNTYVETLENDIGTLQDLSHMCRGEWCRILESEVDALQNELVEFTILEGDFESGRVEEMASSIRDAYRHLAPDIHI
jgi:hypothetical protein